MAEAKDNAQEEASDKQEVKDTSPNGSRFKPVKLTKEITIFPSDPVSVINNTFLKTFRAEHKSSQKSLFAILCNHSYTPRISKANAFATTENANLSRLIASCVIAWPVDNREYYTFIYEDMGNPLSSDDENCAMGIKSERLMPNLVVPLAYTLRDLRNSDIFHGQIRPSNIYDGGQKDLKMPILGECLALPPGFGQPAVFEPVERALAQPTGKGIGLAQDDLYAFGVTVAMLLRRTNPLKGLTDHEIVRRKMEHGSFAAVIGRERITGPLLELLRGLLSDDPKQRWTIEDLMAWVDGRRLSPKQAQKKKLAARPIVYNGHKIFYASHLAMEIAAAPELAHTVLENDELRQWVDRSLDDKKILEAVDEAMRVSSSSSRPNHPQYNRMVSRVVMALDPEGPIRFKEIATLPDGIGYVLTEAFVNKQSVHDIYDMIVNDDFMFWISNNQDTAYDVMSLAQKFETSRGYAKTNSPGYGIERCVYLLDPGAPCMSPILKDFFVRSPEDMLVALEKLASRAKPERILDRHMIAYLSNKEKNLVENALIDINSTEEWRRNIGILKVLATIQRYSDVKNLVHLSNWFVDRMEPVYNRFHDRNMRKRLEKKLQSERDKGDLNKIYSMVDDPEALAVDSAGFQEAMRSYKEMETERGQIERALEYPQRVGTGRGSETAALVSLVLSLLIIAGIAIMIYGGPKVMGM